MSSLELHTDSSNMIETDNGELDHDLYENYPTESPSLNFFKTLWRARIREKSKQFFVMYIIGLVLSLTLISIDMTSQSTIDEYKDPPYTYDNDPVLLFYVQVISDKFVLSLGPRNSFVEELQNFFNQHGNISFNLKDSVQSMTDHFNSETSQALGAYFSQSLIGESSSNFDFTVVNKKSSQFAQMEFYNSIFRCIFNETTSSSANVANDILLNLSSRFFSHPKMKPNVNNDCVTAFYVILSYYYISIVSSTLMFKFNTEKVLFLLNINGLTDFMMYSTFVLCSLLENVPITIVVSLAITFISKSLKGSNFLIVLITTILMMLGRTFFTFVSATFFLRFNSFPIHYLVTILILCVFMVLTIFISKLPEKLFIVLSAFSPTESYLMSFLTLLKCKEKIGALSFSTMNEKFYGMSMSQILGLQICNVIIMFLLMILFMLNMDRLYGHARIGWKNMFKKDYWKRLFRKSKTPQSIRPYVQSVMKIEGLEKTYKGHVETKALAGINCEIMNNDIIIMIGPNGSGKSTLIDCIIGTISFDKGLIEFFGEDLNGDFSLIYENLGIVFQDNVLINELTVEEHFKLIGSLHSIPKKKIENDISHILSILCMSDCKSNRADSLSGGQKRKLCIALALLNNPPLLIFDEPTAGVDVQSREVIWKAMTLFKNTTSLITTHALEEAESICSRLFIMVNGKITFMGTPAELRRETDCGYILSIIEENQNIYNVSDNLLGFIQNRIPEAKKLVDKEKSFIFPADLRVADLLEEIEKEKENIGLVKYTIHIQNLEESLVKLIENEEVNQKKS